MSLRAHTIKPKEDSKKEKKRVGRGDSSGKGTYCGRGVKGQRARSGGKSNTLYIGMKRDIKKIPKMGGFESYQTDEEVVNVNQLEDKFEDGETVSPWILKEKNIIDKPKRGVKILGEGDISVGLKIKDCDFSSTAKEKIEDAGGEIL